MKRLAIFASGSGSNAQNIIEYFLNNSSGTVAMILTNNPKAFVIERVAKFNIPVRIFDHEFFNNSTAMIELLSGNKIDLIVLAGFLWLIPKYLIKAYPKKIINIHPALLPKYGGKGMYGSIVHETVIQNQEKESGITIHYVNENYDEGSIIFQARCEVKPDDTSESLANRVHELEYLYYPKVIEELLIKMDN